MSFLWRLPFKFTSSVKVRQAQYLAEEPDITALFAAFPHLTLEDVKACLDYARDLVEEEEIFPPADKEPYHANL